MRILNHIVVQVKLSDLSEPSAQTMLSTALTISQQALLMSSKNVMLLDSTIALLLSTMRVLSNEHFVANDSTAIDVLAR